MDLEVILKGQERMIPINPEIGNGYSYEKMKDATWEVDNCLTSAFRTLNAIGVYYEGFEFLPLYESLLALSRTHSNSTKRSLEITHTDAFPINCRIKYVCPVTGQVSRFSKTTQVTFLRRGNVFTNKDSKYIVSPRLGDRVFSLDRDNIFVSISRSRMVFHRTPYMFNIDGRVTSIDIHRAKLYYDGRQRKYNANNQNGIPTLVNYMLADRGLTRTFKEFYDVDVKYVLEDDFVEEDYPGNVYTICRSHGYTKGRHLFRSRTVLIFKNDQFTKDLMHVVGAVFFILDNRLDCPSLVINRLDESTGWIRALASWALDETNILAAMEKIDSHVESVKAYIDDSTCQKFLKEGYIIKDVYDLFKFIIANFPIIASTCDVASMENKVLSIVPHFLFRLTSSIFRMMFELQKPAAKKPLSTPQFEKLLARHWKEEAALSGVTMEDNIRNLDHATDVMVAKATRIIAPQAKRGTGGKKMAEMNDRAFAFHWSKIGITTPQFVNKSSPTAIDSLNPTAIITKDGVVKPHPEALPVIRNIRDLTEVNSTVK